MPSYRVLVPIGVLRAGVAPPEVLPAVVDAVAAHTDVEAHEVVLVRGAPAVQVRFSLTPAARDDEDARARATAHAASDAASRLAEIGAVRVLRRAGQRWAPVPGVEARERGD